MTESDLLELLIRHTEAWNRHDLDRLMELFDDDCVFEASGGDEVCGTRHQGHENVRGAFAEVLESMPDANWGNGRHYIIAPDYGVSEWTPHRHFARRAPASRSTAVTSSPCAAERSSPRTPTASSGHRSRVLRPNSKADQAAWRRRQSNSPARTVRSNPAPAAMAGQGSDDSIASARCNAGVPSGSTGGAATATTVVPVT